VKTRIFNREIPIQPANGATPSKRTGGKQTQSAELSPRQTEVVQLVAQGLSDKQIGNRLGLTEGTVGWYLNRIFVKWQVHSRVEVALRFQQEMSPKPMPEDSPHLTNVRVVATPFL